MKREVMVLANDDFSAFFESDVPKSATEHNGGSAARFEREDDGLLSTSEFIQAELDAILEKNHIKPSKTEATLVEALTAPTSSGLEPDSADDQQLMQELLNQMSELSDEVKKLREELDSVRSESTERLCDKSSDPADGFELPQKKSEETVSVFSDGSKRKKKKKNKALTVVSNLLFYTVLVLLVFGAFLIKSNKGGRPWSIGGYSAMTVLTGSMQDVYPQGSLIITETVDTDKLKIGDDITFMTGETSSITHRIIGITENYLETGERGFETKGVMNANADKDMVAAGNVVGRVVFCSLFLGKAANFITANWQLLLFIMLVLVALVAFLQWNARHSKG